MKKNVLMLSLDAKIFDASSLSDSQARHLAYAKALADRPDGGHLLILVPTSNKTHVTTQLTPSCSVVPAFTHLLGRFFALLRAGKKILEQHPVHTVTTQSPFDDGLAGYLLAKRAGARFIPQIRGDIFSRSFLFERFPFALLVFPLCVWLLRRAAAIHVVSHWIERTLRQRGFRNQIAVLPSAISFQPFQFSSSDDRSRFRLQHNIPDSTVVFLFVGTIHPVKNIPFLLRAFTTTAARMPNVQLVIAGDGPDRSSIHAWQRANPHNATKVLILGPILHADIGLWYAAADVFVLSSKYEGLSRALREAARSSLPIIATEVSGADEVVVDGENGFLCAQNDQAAYASAMQRLATDTELRKRFGEFSRAHEAASFNTEALIRKRIELWLDPLT